MLLRPVISFMEKAMEGGGGKLRKVVYSGRAKSIRDEADDDDTRMLSNPIIVRVLQCYSTYARISWFGRSFPPNETVESLCDTGRWT